MSGLKDSLVILGFTVSTSLIAAVLTAMLVSGRDSRMQYAMLNTVCGNLLEREPEAEPALRAALKESIQEKVRRAQDEDILSMYGYHASDFENTPVRQKSLVTMAGFLTGTLLFVITFLYRNHKEAARIRALAAYLEQVNLGKALILSTSGEDDFSRLEDEIYKTVTFLYQTKETALQARNEFARNLSNIAHQIKTPLTAISLSAQMIKEGGCDAASGQAKEEPLCRPYIRQIEKQLLRLTRLEESLLVLSRLDAGALVLHQKEEDVFTLLTLAADNLQELLDGSGTKTDIPELGGMAVFIDFDWTMEAVMNLMKNCMEHNQGGMIHCSYAQNPLYTEILIWDEGEGFAKEDMPCLFQRFYRGHGAGEGGVGIGLALAKEILERQNATIRARNLQEGGACFEIRFYCH